MPVKIWDFHNLRHSQRRKTKFLVTEWSNVKFDDSDICTHFFPEGVHSSPTIRTFQPVDDLVLRGLVERRLVRGEGRVRDGGQQGGVNTLGRRFPGEKHDTQVLNTKWEGRLLFIKKNPALKISTYTNLVFHVYLTLYLIIRTEGKLSYKVRTVQIDPWTQIYCLCNRNFIRHWSNIDPFKRLSSLQILIHLGRSVSKMLLFLLCASMST